VAFHLYAIPDRQHWPTVGKLVDRFAGSDQRPLATRFHDTPHYNSSVVQDQERDPNPDNRRDSSDSSHNQTLTGPKGPQFEARVLTRLGVRRSRGT